MNKGAFFEQLEDGQIIIERKIFAHQFYNRLLVSEIVVKRKNSNPSGKIIK